MKVRYQFRIYPTDEQKQQIHQSCGIARWWWNFFLDQETSHYKITKKFLFYKETAKLIKEQKVKNQWLKEVSSTISQQVGMQLEQALVNSFRNGKGFPKFKSRKENQGSYSLPQINNHIERIKNKYVKLPKLGLVKAKIHRHIPGKINTTTIIWDDNRYYVSFVVDIEIKEQIREIQKDKAVGINLGLTDFATTSDNEIIANPRFLKKKQRRLKIRQRKVSRAQKGSNKRKKKVTAVRNTHKKVRFTRANFHWQIVNDLVKKYDLICVENLNVKGLMRSKLAKSISDVGWSEFINKLKWLAIKNGKSVQEINRFDPSTKTCNKCGHKQDMPRNIRIYNCCGCGHTDARDHNAAMNILDWGYKLYTTGTVEIYDQKISLSKTKSIGRKTRQNESGKNSLVINKEASTL